MANGSAIDLPLPQARLAQPITSPTLVDPLAPLVNRSAVATPAMNNALKSLGALDAVQAALTNSLSMRTAVSGLHIQAQRLVRVARAEFSPKLGASINTQRSDADASGVQQRSAQALAALDLNWRLRSGANIRLGNNVSRNAQSAQEFRVDQGVSVSITQPLLRGAGRVVTEAGLSGAESAYRVAAKALGQTAQSLVAQVLSAYITAQQAQEATRQAQLAHDLAQRLYDLNTALVSAGRSPRNVLLQSESDISASRLGVAQAQNTQRLAVRALAQTMGRSNLLDGLELRLTDTFESKDVSHLPEEQTLVAQALQTSAEIFAAREAVAQAQLALVVARDALLPSLAVSAGSTLATSNPVGTKNRDRFVGISFEYSFDRAPLQLEKEAAQVNLDTANALLQEAEQRVRDAAIDALRNLNFARAQYDLTHNALALATQRLDADVTRHSLGRASQLELTTAQQSLAASNRQLLDAARQVFLSRLELAQIDGSLLQKWGAQNLLDGWIAQAQQELNK